MQSKEIVAMLLAGGQGSRLGVLTSGKAKPAVNFGGMYRIIDFPLSNCVNSGVNTVGVLTQYEPLELNRHIGIGVPWDLDSTSGGVTILSPYVSKDEGNWFSGTANAIYHNINYLDQNNPEYVLIISGDHIYKMDYAEMLQEHKDSNAECTIAVLEVPLEEASRFGIMNVDENDFIYEFEEKPENPKSNLASMGIYIFTWKTLRRLLIQNDKKYDDADFGMHIIPQMINEKSVMKAHRFSDYWRDVGTIDSFWHANMDLVQTLPDFNLYSKDWPIYTKLDNQTPQYIGRDSEVKSSIVSSGCEIYGNLHSSVLGLNVKVGKGSVVRDSIIMGNTVIGENVTINKAIIDENSVIEDNVVIGIFDSVPNKERPKIYNSDITVVGAGTTIPENVAIGKNCVVNGVTTKEHYINSCLESGETLDLLSEEDKDTEGDDGGDN